MDPSRPGHLRSDRAGLHGRGNDPLLLRSRPTSASLHRRDHFNLRLRHRSSPRITPMTCHNDSAPQGGPYRVLTFGLTCAKYQSGEVDRNGRISRCGDEMMRVMLYEAAQSMLHSKKWSWLKAWAMQVARRRGMKKAIVALARRLAVIMHRIWVDGTEFRWTRERAAAAA